MPMTSGKTCFSRMAAALPLAGLAGILAIAGPASAGNPAQCAVYANQAVQHHSQNLAQSCGYSGPRWQANYHNHFLWCMSAPDSAIAAEHNARLSQLAVCAGGGGGGGGAARVCVWDHANYQGASICVNAGMSDSSINPAWNDRVSSLKTYGGAKIRLCQEPGYMGFCNTFQGNVPQLGGALNNKASSYQVFQ